MEDTEIVEKKEGAWVKLMLSPHTAELLAGSHDVFILLTVIAWRQRRMAGKSKEGIEQGWAKLGDYENYGLSRSKYRTAIKNAEKMELATFKMTNKGTLGKLMNTRVINADGLKTHQQFNHQLTIESPSKQPSVDHQLTTFKDIEIEDQRYRDLLISEFSSLIKEEKYKALCSDEFRSLLIKWWIWKIRKKMPPPVEAVEYELDAVLSIGVEEASKRIKNALRGGWMEWQYEPAKSGSSDDADDDSDYGNALGKGR